MPWALRHGDIAGAVVAVVKDGQILTERGYGFADVEKRTPVDPKLTLFRPGSVSKLITWTAVMQQVEQGKIDLDADINKYLDFRIPERDGKPVTMRNLMQHTAGFEEQAKGILSDDPKDVGFEKYLKVWVPHRVYAVGGTPAYSNYGASLAAYIVQRVSGEPFDDYVDKHIFAPLDMKHSTFRQPLPADLAPLMSKGYSEASEDPKPFEIIGPSPAGSMSASGEDMAHFMIAHLQNGEYHGNRILKAETAEQMHNSPLTVLPPLNRMELGFFETNINGREVIGHLGDTNAFHTSLHLFLKENVGFYASFNSPGKEGVVQPLRETLFQDFADRYFPAARATPAVDEKTAAEHARAMVGSWEASRASKSSFLAAVGLVGQSKVALDKKGGLVLPWPGANGKPRHWVEIAPWVWQDRDAHDMAAAQVVDGKPVRWSFDFASPFEVFDRVPWYADGAWLLPLLGAGAVALLLTAIFWPVAAIVRRRYRAPLALDLPALKAYRGSRVGAVLIVAALILWTSILSAMLKDYNYLSTRSDWLVHVAQVFGIVAFLGGFYLMLRNLRAVWGGKRRWPARLWSIVLVIAAGTVVWVGFVFHLMSFGTNY
ncbi:MAG: beta-lactamase family protein [Proteobacteria bacterium]|nr:beta-lactamase family protein [Pseudomonadota bacterium]